MLGQLERTISHTQCLLSKFDPAALSGVEARAAVEAFVELEKLAASGKTLAAGRLAETGAWVGDGSFRNIEAWMASISGVSYGAARGTVGTGQRAKNLPALADALRSGDLSAAQAEAVSTAATADPAAERALLDAAKTSGLKGLKAECDRVSAAAASREDETKNYERIYADRSLRHRKGRDGTGHIEIRGPLDQTAAIMAGLEPLEQELFEQNRMSKTVVEPDAVAFDALVHMAEQFSRGFCNPDSGGPDSGGPDCGAADAPVRPSGTAPKTRGSRPLATIVVHVSKTAYERGWTEPGEICEIEGIGPIPVAIARKLASDAILKAVVIDGVDVSLVSHLGRTIGAHLRTAIETRDRACVIAGCEVDRHLQIDHNVPVAAQGLTSLANLARLCHHHHGLKTVRDLRRIGPLGQQRLVDREEYARAGPGP